MARSRRAPGRDGDRGPPPAAGSPVGRVASLLSFVQRGSHRGIPRTGFAVLAPWTGKTQSDGPPVGPTHLQEVGDRRPTPRPGPAGLRSARLPYTLAPRLKSLDRDWTSHKSLLTLKPGRRGLLTRRSSEGSLASLPSSDDSCPAGEGVGDQRPCLPEQ